MQNGSAEANSDIKGNGSDEQESLRFTRSVNDYENAVDAFLEDSLMFGGPAERKQNPSFASITNGDKKFYSRNVLVGTLPIPQDTQ